MFTHIKIPIRKKSSKRGYVIVEACIFMPIFIIGIASLCFIIKYGILFEKAYVTSLDETRIVMRDMYAGEAAAVIAPLSAEKRLAETDLKLRDVKVSPIKPALLFPGTDRVKRWDFELNLSQPMGISIRSTETSGDVGAAGYSAGDAGASGYSAGSVSTAGYSTGNSLGGSYSIYFRPFIGKDNSAACFEAPSEEEEYEEVWVFPKEGERYHTAACYIVTSYAQQRILSTGLKTSYSPCKLCHAGSLVNGAVVYCFTKEGNKYHKVDCQVVEKYVISMDRKDAAAKGYTPCKICGGYNHD